MKRWLVPSLCISLIAACHCVTLYAIASSPSFENSNDLDPAVNLLLCPMFLVLAVFPRMYGSVAEVLMGINSLIWGACLYLLAAGFSRVIRR